VCSGRLLLGAGGSGGDVEKQHAAGFGACSSFFRACSTRRGRKALVPARRPASKLGATRA